jgi:hypothetical protein
VCTIQALFGSLNAPLLAMILPPVMAIKVLPIDHAGAAAGTLPYLLPPSPGFLPPPPLFPSSFAPHLLLSASPAMLQQTAKPLNRPNSLVCT